MDKSTLLHELNVALHEGMLTKDEVLAMVGDRQGVTASDAHKNDTFSKHIGITEILYYIGGAIVCMGIAILIFQHWGELTPATRILATLGAGITAYMVGILFSQNEKTEGVGYAFHLIAALVMPLGLAVTLDAANINPSEYAYQTLISGVLLATYLVSFWLLRKNIFLLFAILFGSWSFFAATSWMLGGVPLDWSFFEYRVLIVGLAYLMFAYSFSDTEQAALSGPFYALGIMGFLGAALALGGWSPDQSVFWELVFPGLVFASLFLSVHLKARSLLTFGALYLMAYILKITAEYFTQGLGWPLSLVIAGLLLIAVGYASVYLNRKYLAVV